MLRLDALKARMARRIGVTVQIIASNLMLAEEKEKKCQRHPSGEGGNTTRQAPD